MTALPEHASDTASTSQASALQELQTRLIEEMADAWRRGVPLAAEAVLRANPELGAHPEIAVGIIYEEICHRQELGQEVPSLEVLSRFPQWSDQLEVLLGCRRLLDCRGPLPVFPEVGEMLGDFHLLAELGRGSLGRIYLAQQASLADRPVVLKVTPCDGWEHLTLARLQHTHIVPLYAVDDLRARHLRVLCMPHLGGTAWRRILDALKDVPPVERTGRHVLDALDLAPAAAVVPASGPARQYLARASYVEAVCWIGTCLADALQHAHERGLVHLDLKSSNVLLTAEGLPMLLDFHLREPLQAGTSGPHWLGGTPGSMSPEQEAAMAAMRDDRTVPTAVDARSDIYSLGVLLWEALTGEFSLKPPVRLRQLRRGNPHVSVGLADILGRCLARHPGDRYRDAGTLAADLRCHLTDLPLHGVANRSLLESWRKWRRRRPHVLGLTGLVLAILLTVFAACVIFTNHVGHERSRAEEALAEGQQYLKTHEYAKAVDAFSRGLTLAKNTAGARSTPGGAALVRELERHLRLARRAQAAEELHSAADRLRFLWEPGFLGSPELRKLEAHCRSLWDVRGLLIDSSGPALDAAVEQRIRHDLLDLAILWSDLKVRLTPQRKIGPARQQALAVLAEAEALFGQNLVLYRERQSYAAALGMTDAAGAAGRLADRLTPQTPWEHYALSRYLLRSGQYQLAAEGLERAVEMQPKNLWPHFYLGLCAYRLQHYNDALTTFTVCVTLAPHSAPCYCNRALTQAALGRLDRAIKDYNRALQLDPTLAAAALNRGILHYREQRYVQAAADLRRALELGAAPGTVHYNMALVYLAQQDSKSALQYLREALLHSPGHQQALKLQKQLQQQP